MRPRSHLLVAVLVGILVLAACGDAGEGVDPTAATTTPTTLPSPGDVAGGLLAGGGLTVSEALATDATGVLALRGFIVDDGNQALLCEGLAESAPPQCGGASVMLSGYGTVDPAELRTEQGVTWTDREQVLFGELVDGTLEVSSTVSG